MAHRSAFAIAKATATGDSFLCQPRRRRLPVPRQELNILVLHMRHQNATSNHALPDALISYVEE